MLNKFPFHSPIPRSKVNHREHDPRLVSPIWHPAMPQSQISQYNTPLFHNWLSWRTFLSLSVQPISLDHPLARSPWSPSCASLFENEWVPSQTSVLPFSGVISISPMLTTSANGELGCAKSASEWVGCALDSIPGDRGSALFPETKDNLGFGPRTEDVTCVAIGLRKISGEKYFFVRGGSCWILLCKVSSKVGRGR